MAIQSSWSFLDKVKNLFFTPKNETIIHSNAELKTVEKIKNTITAQDVLRGKGEYIQQWDVHDLWRNSLEGKKIISLIQNEQQLFYKIFDCGTQKKRVCEINYRGNVEDTISILKASDIGEMDLGVEDFPLSKLQWNFNAYKIHLYLFSGKFVVQISNTKEKTYYCVLAKDCLRLEWKKCHKFTRKLFRKYIERQDCSHEESLNFLKSFKINYVLFDPFLDKPILTIKILPVSVESRVDKRALVSPFITIATMVVNKGTCDNHAELIVERIAHGIYEMLLVHFTGLAVKIRRLDPAHLEYEERTATRMIPYNKMSALLEDAEFESKPENTPEFDPWGAYSIFTRRRNNCCTWVQEKLKKHCNYDMGVATWGWVATHTKYFTETDEFYKDKPPKNFL
jgi:hypothetical protein